MIKLELIRIFTHKIIHVLFRRAMADMNESTPKLLKLKAQDQVPKAEECGILIELELFGAKINFMETCALASFDGAFFFQLLQDVINGNTPNLDAEKFIVIKPSDYPNMALDIYLPKEYILDL